MLVSRKCNAFKVHVSEVFSSIEVLCVDTLYCDVKCRFIAVYRPTDAFSQTEESTVHLVKCIESLVHVTWPCYIAGDFNAPNINWFPTAGANDSVTILWSKNHTHSFLYTTRGTIGLKNQEVVLFTYRS